MFTISNGSYALDQRSGMIDSVDDLKFSRLLKGFKDQTFKWSTKIASTLNQILKSAEGSFWRYSKPNKKTVYFEEDRPLA